METLDFQRLLSSQVQRRRFLLGALILASFGISTLPRRGWATPKPKVIWRTPEELLEIGFSRSRVVMMNEAHSGLERSIRTRLVGQRLLPTAHCVGVRNLAMEALDSLVADEANRTRKLPQAQGYLAQPEMRAFIQSALDLGWTLIPYEADLTKQPKQLSGIAAVNWREEVQARNLIAALQALPPKTKLFVWCGNSHHMKVASPDWLPMGYQFQRLSGIEPFAIDQTVTVNFPDSSPQKRRELEQFTPKLAALGGTAGFLRQEAPPSFKAFPGIDAFVLSTQNELE